MATYVAVIGVFIISGGASSVPMSSLPSRFLRDLGVLVETPIALVVSLLFVAGASWGMTVFPRETERPAVAQVPALTADQQGELAKWWDLQPKPANFPFDNNGAKVLVVEFADFQCPHCKQMYFALKPVLDKYQASNPKEFTFIFKTWPLNSHCNASVPVANFVASCDASAAYIMAKQKGTGDALKDWFFLHQDELSPDTVRRVAGRRGQDPRLPGRLRQGDPGSEDRRRRRLVARRALDADVLHQRPRAAGRRHRAAVLRFADPAGARASQVRRRSA